MNLHGLIKRAEEATGYRHDVADELVLTILTLVEREMPEQRASVLSENGASHRKASWDDCVFEIRRRFKEMKG